MYKLFIGGNFHEVVENVSKENYSVVNASFSGGLLTVLGRSGSKGNLHLLQGYNHGEVIDKVNELGEVEFSLLDSPCKFFFVREKVKSEKR